jgi:hypothetical protein
MFIGSIVVTAVLVTVGPGVVDREAGLGIGLAVAGGVATLGALIGAIRFRATAMTEPVPAGRVTSMIIVLAAVSEGGLFMAAIGYAFSPSAGVIGVGLMHLLVFLVLSTTLRSSADW